VSYIPPPPPPEGHGPVTEAGRKAHAELLRALAPPPFAVALVVLAVPLAMACAALWWLAMRAP